MIACKAWRQTHVRSRCVGNKRLRAQTRPTRSRRSTKHSPNIRRIRSCFACVAFATTFTAASMRPSNAFARRPIRGHYGLIASNLGAALAQSGNIDAALRMFRRATELDPTLIDAWFNLGRALDLRHDASGAHAAFDAVLELDPRHRPARILRAEAAKTLGRIVEAEDELRAVLREDPHRSRPGSRSPI